MIEWRKYYFKFEKTKSLQKRKRQHKTMKTHFFQPITKFLKMIKINNKNVGLNYNIIKL